jgi:hypothetical protein
MSLAFLQEFGLKRSRRSPRLANDAARQEEARQVPFVGFDGGPTSRSAETSMKFANRNLSSSRRNLSQQGPRRCARIQDDSEEGRRFLGMAADRMTTRRVGTGLRRVIAMGTRTDGYRRGRLTNNAVVGLGQPEARTAPNGVRHLLGSVGGAVDGSETCLELGFPKRRHGIRSRREVGSSDGSKRESSASMWLSADAVGLFLTLGSGAGNQGLLWPSLNPLNPPKTPGHAKRHSACTTE